MSTERSAHTLIDRNDILHSVATAFATKVFPVPTYHGSWTKFACKEKKQWVAVNCFDARQELSLPFTWRTIQEHAMSPGSSCRE